MVQIGESINRTSQKLGMAESRGRRCWRSLIVMLVGVLSLTGQELSGRDVKKKTIGTTIGGQSGGVTSSTYHIYLLIAEKSRSAANPPEAYFDDEFDLVAVGRWDGASFNSFEEASAADAAWYPRGRKYIVYDRAQRRIGEAEVVSGRAESPEQRPARLMRIEGLTIDQDGVYVASYPALPARAKRDVAIPGTTGLGETVLGALRKQKQEGCSMEKASDVAFEGVLFASVGEALAVVSAKSESPHWCSRSFVLRSSGTEKWVCEAELGPDAYAGFLWLGGRWPQILTAMNLVGDMPLVQILGRTKQGAWRSVLETSFANP